MLCVLIYRVVFFAVLCLYELGMFFDVDIFYHLFIYFNDPSLLQYSSLSLSGYSSLLLILFVCNGVLSPIILFTILVALSLLMMFVYEIFSFFKDVSLLLLVPLHLQTLTNLSLTVVVLSSLLIANKFFCSLYLGLFFFYSLLLCLLCNNI